MKIVITGIPGSGKTTVGKLLSRILKLKFIDMDEYIEQKTGLKINEIFLNYGELYFREMERKACKELSESEDCVISTGGKTLLYKENLNQFYSFIIITLLSTPETIIKRLDVEYKTRPLLFSNPAKSILKLYKERIPIYQKFPNKIETDDLNPEEVVEKILTNILNGKERKIKTETNHKNSLIVIKKGLSNNLSSYIHRIYKGSEIFILMDKIISNLYGKKILRNLKKNGLNPKVYVITSKEKIKNLNIAKRIYSWLMNERANRSSLFISIGGGVISDLGGFIASTYHRGIKLINIPTTLLSQIDASIGGKNGINFNKAKNQIGTIYFPEAILIDPLFLISLKKSYIKEGLVEALKTGIIGDQYLYNLIKNHYYELILKDLGYLEELIYRSIKVKLSIVEKDAYERNLRKLLNLGHTFAHAFESCLNYKISHGKAVGLGLICAFKLGVLLNMCSENYLEEIKKILKNAGLPTKIANLNASEIISFMQYDKKRKGEKISFIIPRKIGEVKIKTNISINHINECLREIIK
ncbi:3-dehydroquinate synthase [Candidatus Aminicenantes bacterium AC-708-M15]|jgi:shikimate kinase/3-dehydroquinate synthase|nr:3-dehydroquinate synthase [SCandidatus Aminicenantes bacterium Aminicenantia_JdfR_composite]MCP2597094.1 3-dehydroquinate synthase [Candidatus Aminicenantes bacterium AC-335-G13]MCP2604478.1 3-dehydroquinate synthase [Candidatus Aminicenantes bacterium AC-708-M15]MCP2605687.1 3-dehydroquinate synthase [Candidatus Aminicenantes bacterium AC-335-O07]MCP2606336.1 3-dehydroquinate synthase [Candidatus Aminicenantes bacterium AC-708-I09]MCP2618715.1 3-dehydroquinate synthase [Candidatus Aminicen